MSGYTASAIVFALTLSIGGCHAQRISLLDEQSVVVAGDLE